VIENGDLILKYLERLGVEYVFGIPGGSIEPFYNALARSERQNGIKAILARHESGAAFMADGYARATGKIGVCCATSGPGATNLLTGVANAYADGIPMLVITAQPAIEKFGLGAFQEGSCTGINTLSIFDSCTRFNTLVSHSAQLEHKLLMAISHAMSNRPGPVHLSIPSDIMRAEMKSPSSEKNLRAFINHEVVPHADGVDLVLKSLADAKKVTLLVGDGCADAMPDIIALAENRAWLLVTTPMGKGLVPEFHPLYRGVFGLGGHQSAQKALHPDNADRIVVIGTGFDEISTAGWDENGILSDRTIHISANAEQLSRSIMTKAAVLGSPRLLLEAFSKRLKTQETKASIIHFPTADGFPKAVEYRNKFACASMQSPIKPQALFWKLRQSTPAHAHAVMDTGNSFLWGIHYWQTLQLADASHLATEYEKRFHIGMGFAAMGWAIGASIGIALAKPDTPVICFTGDGSVLMNGQEMSVAKEYNLNILFVILNDSHLGMIKHGQQLGGAEAVCHELPTVDFAAMAQAQQVPSRRIEQLSDLDEMDWTQFFIESGPCVLDVIIDAKEVPPMGSRMKVLAGGKGNE